MQDSCDRLIDPHEADKVCGTSRTVRYRLVEAGQFPKPVKIGKAVRFSLRECQEWVQQRIAERDQAGAS